MAVERSVPTLRADGNTGPLAKKMSPAKVKKTVSAAAVFKKQSIRTDQNNGTPRTNGSVYKFSEEDADATTLLSAKLRSSSRSTEQRVAKRKSSDMHPLGVAFRDVSNSYRHYLYKTASSKINETLGLLLRSLYESTLQTVTPSSSQQEPNGSPLKLSAPAKYERLATQLYQPLSQFTLTLRRTDSEGKSVRFSQTLETRMLHYEELVAKETVKLAKMQKEWEVVVGEIWKLGVACLGEKAMEEMLFTRQRLDGSTLALSSSPSAVTNAESTLFVSEHDHSPHDESRARKKRVTFLEEEAPYVHDKNAATPTTVFPNFIYQPSRYRKDTLPLPLGLPENDIKELAKELQELGKQAMSELRRIEKEHQAYWKKKNAQLAVALKSD